MALEDTVTRSRGNLAGSLLLVVAVALFIGLLFPAIPKPAGKVRPEAKVAVGQLTTALKQYHAEYGKWPDFTGDGDFVEPAKLGQLMRVLRALDDVSNPRKIVFFEYTAARPGRSSKQRFVSGLEPITGVLLDPWGNPYRIKLDADDDGVTVSPYRLNPAPSIRTNVLVWSLGNDGQQADQYRGPGNKISDDIVSWE
jgi:hypothetical protein